MVGASTRFLSGISYYTMRLANALAADRRVGAILMRQMLPTRLYPGRTRVGAPLTDQRYRPDVEVLDGVDWYWFPSLFAATRMLFRRRPDVVVFQWWTGTVLHTYLALALMARLRGSRVIIEFHEVLDTAEASIGLVSRYVGLIAPLLMRLADGFVIHSTADREPVMRRYRLGRRRPIVVIPHGPFDHHVGDRAQRAADANRPTNLLYFGVIRPFKGVEDLIAAFEELSSEDPGRYRLTVIGETWEGWTKPARLIQASAHRDQVDFVNRYVTDEELTAALATADVVVLPYHRSSASGPLHTAMSAGVPVVTTSVPALQEASRGYAGAVLVAPRDHGALVQGIRQAVELSRSGQRFRDPHSWEATVARLDDLMGRIGT